MRRLSIFYLFVYLFITKNKSRMNESPLNSLDLAFWSLHGIKTKALETVKYFLFSFIINNVYVVTLVAFACKMSWKM